MPMMTNFGMPSGRRQQQPGAGLARPSFQFPQKQPGMGATGTIGGAPPAAFNPSGGMTGGFKGGMQTGAPAGGTKPMFGGGNAMTLAPLPLPMPGQGGGGRRDPNMFGGYTMQQLLADPTLVSRLSQAASSRWNARPQQPTSITGPGLQAPPPAFGGPGTSTEDTITPQPGNGGMTVSTLPLPMDPRSPTTGGIAQMPGPPPVLPQIPAAFKGFGFDSLNAPTGTDAQGLPIYAQRAQGVQSAWDMAGGANRGQLRINPQTGQQEIYMGSGQGGDTYSWQGYDPNRLGQRQNAELFQRYGPNWTSGSGATSMHGSDIAGILTEQLGRQPTMQEVYDQYYGVGAPVAGIPRSGRTGYAASGLALPGSFGG